MKHSMNRNSAIGVFDSGLGGLTVVKELMKQLPHEDIVYFGDTARVPYGTKSKESIISFSKENTDILIKKNVKMVVVACNSSSSYAMPLLKKHYTIPILGVIKPGAEKAARLTRNNRIGVIATSATIKSGQYTKNILKFNRNAKIISQPCALFVPLVEEGWFDDEATKLIAKTYLSSLNKFKIDTLILGCTHYPLLRKVIQKTVGNDVILVDSAQEIAEQVKVILRENGLTKTSGIPKYSFLVSDKPQQFGKIARNFLGKEIKATKI